MNDLIKNKCSDLIKRIIVVLIILSNLCVSLPIKSIATPDNNTNTNTNTNTSTDTTNSTDSNNNKDTDTDAKEPALVPMAAYSIIAKYINTSIGSKKSTGSSGNGQANVDTFNANDDGYDTIFTSTTTGRKYKEYRQNLPNWEAKYPIEGLSQSNPWTGECGTVATITLGSGYTNKATFADITKKMEKSDGASQYESWLSEYSGQNVTMSSFNMEDAKNKLSQGYVALVRANDVNLLVSSAGSHYMALLDINSDKSKIYLSNPWQGSNYQGWMDIASLERLNLYQVYYIKNDGDSIDYTGTGKSVTNIAEDKIFYIGDSWIENMLKYKDAKSQNTYFYCKSGKNADWVLDNYSSAHEEAYEGKSLKSTIPSDTSAIVIKFGLNGTNLSNKTQELVDKLLNDYKEKDIFVLQTPHVCEEYSFSGITAEKFNSNVDEYNKSMKEYCEKKSGVTFIDPTTNIVDNSGKGFLKKEYADGTFHLNQVGDQLWYEDIIKSIKNSSAHSSEEGEERDGLFQSSADMSSNIVPRDKNDLSKGYKINKDLDNEIDLMIQYLKELGVDLDYFISNSNQHEYLKNMIKACIVTQYPDLRSAREIASNTAKSPNEMQGCIKVKRYTDEKTKNFAASHLTNPVDAEKDGGGMYLSYKKYDELVKMINDNDRNALNYFSMDSSNNIIVAGWETMNVSIDIKQTNAGDPSVGECPLDVYKGINYTPKAENYQKLKIKSINYLDQVSNYTLQFSLFWALLVYGNDQSFINDFAKLVINTEIVLGCYDSVTTTTTKYTQTFKKEGRVNFTNNSNVPDSERGENSGVINRGHNTITYEFQITEIDTLNSDNPELKVKYADIWTAVYNKNYKIDIKKENEKSEEPIEYEDELLDTQYYNKELGEDGKFHYSGSKKIGDKKLDEKVDNSINNYAIQNNKLLEEDAKEKNKQFEYRYKELRTYLDDHFKNYGSNYKEKDVYKFFSNEEVQSILINVFINQNSDEGISNIFSGNNKTLLKYASKKDIEEVYASEVMKMIDDVTPNSDLYKKLTKNGTDTTLCYTALIMDSSSMTYTITEKDKTEEYEKNIEKEEIKESSSDNNLKWKIEKNSKKDNFVKLLTHSRKAKANLNVVETWFFEALRETVAIADMEDLMKFLFQCVYGTDYGITDEEAKKLLEMFDPKKMQSFNKKSTSRGTIVGGASYSSIKLTDEELKMLYKVVMAEGGSGNIEWTACSILNRLLSNAFPNNLKDMFTYDQYEVMGNGMFDAAVPSQKVIDTVNEVLKTGDVTGGAIGFQTIECFDNPNNGRVTWETPIVLLRERYSGGGSAVFFTTATIQAELAQYK